MDGVIQGISSSLQEHVSAELIVFIVSLLPILELRGGLIVASILGVPLYIAAPIAILGNMLPIPFIIFFIERVLVFLKKHGPIKKFATWIETKGRTAGEKLQAKHPKSLYIGLLLFVGIPLPGTGAWTGGLVAALLGLKPKKSAPFIFLGVLLACGIMSLLAYAIPGMFGLK